MTTTTAVPPRAFCVEEQYDRPTSGERCGTCPICRQTAWCGRASLDGERPLHACNGPRMYELSRLPHGVLLARRIVDFHSREYDAAEEET